MPTFPEDLYPGTEGKKERKKRKNSMIDSTLGQNKDGVLKLS